MALQRTQETGMMRWRAGCESELGGVGNNVKLIELVICDSVKEVMGKNYALLKSTQRTLQSLMDAFLHIVLFASDA